MFGVGPATKIYIAIAGVDMRKGFDGLFGLVRDRLGQDPLSGHLFLFANRARTRLKLPDAYALATAIHAEKRGHADVRLETFDEKVIKAYEALHPLSADLD